MRSAHHSYEQAARRQDAAEWWLQLHEDTAPAESLNQWLEWRARDEENAAAFDEIQHFAGRLKRIDPRASQSLITEFADPGRRRWRLRPMSLAACVSLMFAGAILWVAFDHARIATEQHTYATDVGINQSIELPDGSTLFLGGASRAVAVLTDKARTVRLEAGEAYFQVKQDAGRPFEVDAGGIAIRAVGTAFNVRRTGERVAVAITEGRVRVDQVPKKGMRERNSTGLDAAAGQQVSYDGARRSLAVSPADVERAISWRENRLDFMNEPLADVIANLNRYSRVPLRVVDAAAADIVFTGTVIPGKLDNWLTALPRAFPVHIHRAQTEIVITSAH